MPTVVKTIGTGGGRDYSTIAAWQAALPVNLVTDGNSQEGDCYNDSEFSVAGNVVTFSGNTTDASHTITLTTGAGQSFRDNANVQTNALRYNQANGVGLKNTSSYAKTVAVQEDNVFFQGLQITDSGTHNKGLDTGGHTVTMDDCIIEAHTDTVAGSGGTLHLLTAGVYRNSLIISRSSNGAGVTVSYPGSLTIVGLTVVSTNASSDVGINCDHGTVKLVNCAVFGFTTNFGGSGTFSSSSSNNGSDLAISFGTSNQASKTYANQFQNTTDGTHDFRLKSGADCVDNGTTDTVNGTPDIAGTARPAGSAYDIGCWEFVASAVPDTYIQPIPGLGGPLTSFGGFF